MEFKNCPKCGSRLRAVGTAYPKAYECQKCGESFVKSPQALIDD